jgi:hypothetical protein
MATDERPDPPTSVDEVMRRAELFAKSAEAPAVLEPSDLTRAGIEVMVARSFGTARVIHSRGRLRFAGDGVTGHSADLDTIGLLSAAWQKAVSATGAALEGIKNVRGRLSADLQHRTALVLTASPSAGSIVFIVEPKQSPLDEVEPHGRRAITEEMVERPLADRASETLMDLLETTGTAALDEVDAIATRLSALGPRVGSALDGLVRVIESSSITLQADWEEPEKPTRRATVTPAKAKFIAQVIEGRGLNSVEETLIGRLATVSDRQSWLLDLGEEEARLDMSELDPDELSRWKVHERVKVLVRTVMQERPDGRVNRTYTMLSITSAGEPPTQD